MQRIFHIILILLSLCNLSVSHEILGNLYEWKAEVLGEIDELARDSIFSNESQSRTLSAEEIQNLEQKLWKLYQKMVAKFGPIRRDAECKELSAKFERRIEWPLIIGMGICMKVKTAVEKDEFEGGMAEFGPENNGLKMYEPEKSEPGPEKSEPKLVGSAEKSGKPGFEESESERLEPVKESKKSEFKPKGFEHVELVKESRKSEIGPKGYNTEQKEAEKGSGKSSTVKLQSTEKSLGSEIEPSVSEIPSSDRSEQREVIFVGQKLRKICQILHELRIDLNTFVVEMELDALEKENDKNAGKLYTEQQLKEVLARIEHLTDILRMGGANVPCHFSLEPFESATMWMNMKLDRLKLEGDLHAIPWESIDQTLSIMLIEARLDLLDRETRVKLDPDRLDLDTLEQFERPFGQEFKQIRARIQKLDRRGTRKHLEDELETLVVTALGRAEVVKSAILERLDFLAAGFKNALKSLRIELEKMPRYFDLDTDNFLRRKLQEIIAIAAIRYENLQMELHEMGMASFLVEEKVGILRDGLKELLAHYVDKYFLENGQSVVETSEFGMDFLKSEYLEPKIVDQVMEKSKQRVQKAFGDSRQREMGDQKGEESDQNEGKHDQEGGKVDQSQRN